MARPLDWTRLIICDRFGHGRVVEQDEDLRRVKFDEGYSRWYRADGIPLFEPNRAELHLRNTDCPYPFGVTDVGIYRTRSGRPVRITRIRDGKAFNAEGLWFGADGRIFPWTNTAYDLIEGPMTPKSFEADTSAPAKQRNGHIETNPAEL